MSSWTGVPDKVTGECLQQGTITMEQLKMAAAKWLVFPMCTSFKTSSSTHWASTADCLLAPQKRGCMNELIRTPWCHTDSVLYFICQPNPTQLSRFVKGLYLFYSLSYHHHNNQPSSSSKVTCTINLVCRRCTDTSIWICNFIGHRFGWGERVQLV